MQNPLVITCRDEKEVALIREAGHLQATPVYFEATSALQRLSDMENAQLITTSLLLDETGIGLVTKAIIIGPTYIVMWVRHAAECQNVLRLFGSGCQAILGPDELDKLPECFDESESVLNEMVFPPFFSDDISRGHDGAENELSRLHVTFIGSQAMMSCSNAVMNIGANKHLSIACRAKLTSWTQDRLAKTLADYTLWKSNFASQFEPGCVTFCDTPSQLNAIDSSVKQFVICHGHLSPEEESYLQFLPVDTCIFSACPEGYVTEGESPIAPESFWDFIISSLY